MAVQRTRMTEPSSRSVRRGKEKVLHRFSWLLTIPHDGANPVASLIDVRGELYGTTCSGGANQQYGTVFRISRSGREKVLHSFAPLLRWRDTLPRAWST